MPERIFTVFASCEKKWKRHTFVYPIFPLLNWRQQGKGQKMCRKRNHFSPRKQIAQISLCCFSAWPQSSWEKDARILHTDANLALLLKYLCYKSNHVKMLSFKNKNFPTTFWTRIFVLYQCVICTPLLHSKFGNSKPLLEVVDPHIGRMDSTVALPSTKCHNILRGRGWGMSLWNLDRLLWKVSGAKAN